MTAGELKEKLKKQISLEEAEKLRSGGESLCISSFNRDVCLRLLDNCSDEDTMVSDEKIDALESELKDYLNIYMQDRPEGHKWIIIACEYLTFIEHKPMHPQSAAKWTEKDGKYYCPGMQPDSITCRCCMCNEMKKEG